MKSSSTAAAALACALATGALACGSPPPPVALATASSTASSSKVDEPAPDTGTFVSKRFGMRLKLPGGPVWKIDDTTSHWLVAKHSTDGSTLLVRLWRDENRMTGAKCEARARAMRALPSRDGAELLETRPIHSPPDLDGTADVSVVQDPSGRGLFGMILAFGGWQRRCFAYVYVTRAEGPGADVVVGDRLAAMAEASLATLQFESDLDVVLERDAPLPEAPPVPPGAQDR
jgi:hypothetical protein